MQLVNVMQERRVMTWRHARWCSDAAVIRVGKQRVRHISPKKPPSSPSMLALHATVSADSDVSSWFGRMPSVSIMCRILIGVRASTFRTGRTLVRTGGRGGERRGRRQETRRGRWAAFLPAGDATRRGEGT